ncbi:MAG: alpha-L-fucosidase [Phycisphaerae bacterium]
MKYEANWESLEQYAVPEWFRDAKLGIFIHWGVYAVPAFGSEWYPRKMYIEGDKAFEHHRGTWGPQSEFGYKDFIPMFKAEKWQPGAWVELFKQAGARYVVPVAEHHDGFPMYDSRLTRWNAARMGPCRDTVAELERSCRREGLKFGVSSHRAFNWHYYTFREDFDNHDPDHHKLYGVPHPDDAPVSYEFVLDWYARVRELVETFSPDVLWFDFGWHRDEFKPWRPRVAEHYYNHALEHGYEPVLQCKAGARFPDGTAVLDIERGKLEGISEHYWQTDTSVSYRSWGYIEDDEFKPVASLVHDLVDIVSKNGNLLLNIGPRADGTIPHEAANCLLGLGEWLELNGEAVFETRCWETHGEGPTDVPKGFREKEQAAYTAEDIRFTTRGDALYAIALGWPGRELTIRSLGSGSSVPSGRIARVSMLGADDELSWSQDEGGLKVTTPAEPPCEHACVLKVQLKA